MPYLVFHQNMRTYGGNTAIRNAAFNGAFTALSAATGYYWAAGFTEILNAGAVLRGNLTAFAQILDPGLTNLVVIEVGTTALGTREFIGIAWDPTVLNIQHVGHVLWNPVTNQWLAHNTPAGAIPANQTIVLPGAAALAADTRGLAYIAGIRVASGNPLLIGFMHNMYNLGNRSSAFTNLGRMAENAMNTIGGVYGGAEVIIGGDFNLRPRDPKRKRGGTLYLRTRAARVGGVGAYINTTNTHPYDYWAVSSAALGDADARVRPQTRIAYCSDHAGITLLR